MLQPADFEARIIDHRHRAHEANCRGWLRPARRDAGRQITLGAVLGAIRARIAPNALATTPQSLVPNPETAGMAPGR